MNLVDVAVFTFPSDASVLESILQSENIPYFLNNQSSATIVLGCGTRLSVGKVDEEKVKQIIRESGFENCLIGKEE
jgi:hypothetical protein